MPWQYWWQGRQTNNAPWRPLSDRQGPMPPDAYPPLVNRRQQEYPNAYNERRTAARAYQIDFLHMRPDAYAPLVNRETISQPYLDRGPLRTAQTAYEAGARSTVPPPDAYAPLVQREMLPDNRVRPEPRAAYTAYEIPRLRIPEETIFIGPRQWLDQPYTTQPRTANRAYQIDFLPIREEVMTPSWRTTSEYPKPAGYAEYEAYTLTGRPMMPPPDAYPPLQWRALWPDDRVRPDPRTAQTAYGIQFMPILAEVMTPTWRIALSQPWPIAPRAAQTAYQYERGFIVPSGAPESPVELRRWMESPRFELPRLAAYEVKVNPILAEIMTPAWRAWLEQPYLTGRAGLSAYLIPFLPIREEIMTPAWRVTLEYPKPDNRAAVSAYGIPFMPVLPEIMTPSWRITFEYPKPEMRAAATAYLIPFLPIREEVMTPSWRSMLEYPQRIRAVIRDIANWAILAVLPLQFVFQSANAISSEAVTGASSPALAINAAMSAGPTAAISPANAVNAASTEQNASVQLLIH